MNIARSAVGNPSASTKPAGLRAMMPQSWRHSKNVNTSIWLKIVRAGMCFWPIADMCFRWLKWTSNILNSTSRASSDCFLEGAVMVGKTHFCGSDITLVFTDEKFCGYVSIAEKSSRVDLDDIG